MARKALEQVIAKHIEKLPRIAGYDHDAVIALLQSLPVLLYSAQALDARVMAAAISVVEDDGLLFDQAVAELTDAVESWRGQRVPREHPPVPHKILMERHHLDGQVHEWISAGIPWGECQTCGQPARLADNMPKLPGRTRCANCWELEGRLSDYLRSHKGRVYIEEVLMVAKAHAPTDNPYDPCPDCHEFIMTCGHQPEIVVETPEVEWSVIVVRDLLTKLPAITHGRPVSLTEVEGWSKQTLAEVGRWATAVQLSGAEGIDIKVPDKPSVFL